MIFVGFKLGEMAPQNCFLTAVAEVSAQSLIIQILIIFNNQFLFDFAVI